MKKQHLLKLGLLSLVMPLFLACNPEEEEQQPEPAVVPEVTLQAGQAATETLTFTITSQNAEEVKWVCIPKGSRSVTADQVLTNGTAAEVNTTVEVTAEGLTEDSAYEIYAAARNAEEKVLSQVLEMETIYEPKTFAFTATTASADISSNNYYVSFTNEAEGMEFVADIYVAEDATYLPSGTYVLGTGEIGELDADYTELFPCEGHTNELFSEGSLTVVATPNEETREIAYEVEGEFSFVNGDTVTISYEGTIEGIALPSVGVPEGYIEFVVSPETMAPSRRSTGQAHEYILDFYDVNWGQLVIDIYADTAASNNGNGHLPNGTYTLAAGTVDSYSNVTFYEPYWYVKFETSCEVNVSRTDDNYTIVVKGVGTDDSGNEKKVYMTYTGPIKDMLRE